MNSKDVVWKKWQGALDASEEVKQWFADSLEDLTNSSPKKLPSNWSVSPNTPGSTYIFHYCMTGDRLFHVIAYWSNNRWWPTFTEAKVICIGNTDHMKYDGTRQEYTPQGFDRMDGIPED